ncbi:MAG: AMP-binding protein [Proteobacteria bacterium]|nr:AMP-binding protein [Pseudomonadota bacterium]
MDHKAAYLAKPWTAFYPEGVPAQVEVSVVPIPRLFDQVVEKYGHKTALIFYGKKISYRDLSDQIDRLAAALAELGVKKGDKVALFLLNSPQYVIAYMAVLKNGAVVTPVSPVYTSQEVKHQLTDSGAQTVIC